MKGIQKGITWMLPALLAVLAACSDDEPTGPASDGSDLSADEAQFLAEETDRSLDEVLGGLMGEQFAGPAATAGAGPAAVPITTTFSFERTRECRAGGQVVVSGSGELVVDREVGFGEMSVEGSKSIEDCAHERGDVIYTVNGLLEFDAYWLRENHELVAAEKNLVGEFSVVTSDDRMKECTVELHAVYDPETNSVTVTGQICDRVIDHTWSRDDRGDHDGQTDRRRDRETDHDR